MKAWDKVIFKTKGENTYTEGWIVKISSPFLSSPNELWADVGVSWTAPMLFVKLDDLYPHPKEAK